MARKIHDFHLAYVDRFRYSSSLEFLTKLISHLLRGFNALPVDGLID